MKYLLFILGIISLGFSCTSCGPLEPAEKCERDYLFSIPMTLSPALDTFKIGDTIHLSMEFPVEMEDQNSGELFDLTDFPFNTELNIAKLDTIPAFCGNSLMEYIEKEGDLNFLLLSVGCLLVKVDFKKEDNRFIFSGMIVLKSKGLYGFGSHSAFIDEYTSPIKEDCKTKSVEMYYGLTPLGGNTNFNFLQDSDDDFYKTFALEDFNRSAGFVFYVVE